MPLEPDDRPRPRLRIGIGAAIVVVLVALGCAVVASAVAPRGSSTQITGQITGQVTAPPVVQAPEPSPVPSTAVLLVHILGEVRHGGLFEFQPGDRAVDAVAAAGGFTKQADRASVNLARELVDGEQIVVAKRGHPAPPTAAGGAPAAGAPVNLNTADAAALETLPGIGEALAARILAWRDTNGSFTTVDDLGNVTGIGEKTLEGLRELVTV